MEDKVFELLNKMYSEMQEGFKGFNEKIDKLEKHVEELKVTATKIDNIEKDVVDLKIGQKEIKTMILHLDNKNDDRHIELSKKINELRKNLNS